MTSNVGPRLWGRRAECLRLDALIADARGGTSGTLVVRGEPGVGKSALLDYFLTNAAGCRLVRAGGVESEMELAFAVLHQLCAPFLDQIDRLSGPQRDALAVAFGIEAGPPPDRFRVGLAVLSLLAEVAETQPLVCLVDDVQWLDRASAQVLGFVARRLAAEAVVMIFAVREPSEAIDLAGLTEIVVGPLGDADARDLLAATLPGPLDLPVRERIVAESHGNPLALLELPRAWTPAALAGGFGLPDTASVSAKIEESFRRRMTPLPDDSRRLLLVTAADQVGDPILIRAAAASLGIAADADAPATMAGLLDAGGSLRFRHPMVRTVVYQDASLTDRRDVHRALADATDPDLDPDRRAWHLAAAAAGPDESVALELERSAGRAQARGGAAAAAAFLGRAVELTLDPATRSERALTAAQASLQAGSFDTVSTFLAVAESSPLDGYQAARVALLRGHVDFVSRHRGDAPGSLLTAAQRLEPYTVELARETYLTAWCAASVAGAFAGDGTLPAICRAVQALPSTPDDGRTIDLLLDGLVRLTTDGLAAAAPTLDHAVVELRDLPVVDALRWGWAAYAATDSLWDFDATLAIAARHVQLARDAGALGAIVIHLAVYADALAVTGDLQAAAALTAEAESVARATGGGVPPYGSLKLHALLGREREAATAIASATALASAVGMQMADVQAKYAAAIVFNGLGRYDDALRAARGATSHTFEPWVSAWALPEFVEAAVRSGDAPRARAALDTLTERTAGVDADWPRGLVARCRALLADGEVAEAQYREAIERLGRTRLRPELMRAHLLYGEWLRREGRRDDAREQLRTAYDGFVTIGMEAFAERARRELQAAGEHVRQRSVETRGTLTPQELQIARLAGDGKTNPEIGAELFLSRRTVEWHLRKVFDKLEIRSRRELPAALRRVASGADRS